jgi:hypothetical protein
MGEFHAREGDRRRSKRFERKHWRAAALDGPMVLLNDVVEIPIAADHHGSPIWILLT